MSKIKTISGYKNGWNIFFRKKITYVKEVIPTSMKVASGLKNLGIETGQVVQIILPNSCHYFFPAFGAWLIGAAVSVSDPGKNT